MPPPIPLPRFALMLAMVPAAPVVLAPIAPDPIVLAPAAFFLSAPVMAQSGDAAPAGCDTPAQPWRSARSLAAAAKAEDLAKATIAPDQAVRLNLLADPQVAYLTLPRGGGEESSFGGLAAFTITRAGRYMVGLDKPAWIDVVRDGAAAPTIGHGRAPACSGIRKQVSFALEPGDHVLEISGNLDAEIGVVIVPLAD